MRARTVFASQPMFIQTCSQRQRWTPRRDELLSIGLSCSWRRSQDSESRASLILQFREKPWTVPQSEAGTTIAEWLVLRRHPMRTFVHSFTVCISIFTMTTACNDSGVKARGGQGGAGGSASSGGNAGFGGSSSASGAGGLSGSGGSSGAGASYDAGTGQDTGTYSQGPYTCCGDGQRLSCCTKDKGLLGFDISDDGTITPVGDTSLAQANCFRYGGTAGMCMPQGEQVEGKDICAICCAGLKKSPALEPGDGGTCVASGGASLSVAVCLPCGNGVCDKDENRCNCPSDCK
jgi:hypothetical protein